MTASVTAAHCNRCGPLTNHDVLAADRQEHIDETCGQHDYELYEMLKCRGCDTVTLRHTTGGLQNPQSRIVYYPPAMDRHRPMWIDSDMFWMLGLEEKSPIPSEILTLLREIYVAVQSDSLRLAAMGIRAVVEGVMVESVGNKGTFKQKMDLFQERGFLSIRQRGHLDATLEAGHAAIHRG